MQLGCSATGSRNAVQPPASRPRSSATQSAFVRCRAYHSPFSSVTRRQELAALATALASFSASDTEAEAEPIEADIGGFKVSVRYDKFAKTYDQLDNGVMARSLGFPELRQQVVADAAGDVLETGAGTGAQAPQQLI